MKVIVFNTLDFEKEHLLQQNENRHELNFWDIPLNEQTARLAKDYPAVCLFTHDDGSRKVLEILKEVGVQYLALRSAGHNHVDLEAARELELKVANVPEYSPYAIAEHTVLLMLALNRKLIRSHQRVRDLNFSLGGLVGFDMKNQTVGVLGTGRIGKATVKILHGMGCRILAWDLYPDQDFADQHQMEYVSLDRIFSESKVITLHIPLTPETRHLINSDRINQMRDKVMLINTSRGGLVDTQAVIGGLKRGKIGYLGLDVYEEEEGIFFEDHSEDILQDDTLARLMTFPNVLITSHQGFLTSNALINIADTTLYNLDCWEKGIPSDNELTDQLT